MTFLKPLSFFILSLVLLASCTKSTFEEIISNKETENTDPNEYFPLAVGNYWIYETKNFTFGDYSNPIATDSLVITGTVRIKGKDYFQLEEYHTNFSGSQSQISFVRYKNGAVVYSDGSVRMDKIDFNYSLDTTTVQDFLSTRYKLYIREVDHPISTSTTSYSSCIDFKGAEIELDTLLLYEDNKRFMHHYYSKNIGSVQDYCPYSTNQQLAQVKELVRYHIEP